MLFSVAQWNSETLAGPSTPRCWARPSRAHCCRDCPHRGASTWVLPSLWGRPSCPGRNFPCKSGERARGGRPASPRGSGRFPTLSRTQISPPQRSGPISGPRLADQLHPPSKLYPELSPSAPGLVFTPQVEPQRSAPRAPQPGARPTGLANGPGACGATPLPGPAGTGGATATPRKIPLENPGCRGRTGKLGKSRTWRPYMQAFRSAAAPPPPPPPPRNGFKSLRAAAVATAQQPGGGDFRAHIPRPLPHPSGRGLRAAPLPWRRCRRGPPPPGKSGAGLPRWFPRPPGRVVGPGPLPWRRCGWSHCLPGCLAA